ncbi:MAG: BatA and WFA domain-containing protein, partial [Candidatus Woesearchaeota archaeon]|nr:BatA and WFA domain-containing protein [Candidatus Woesearchaeota archaeon]
MQFGSTLGFFAFFSVAALIIIYLIRPRPKDVVIPSLMFIMKESGRALKSSFFEKLLTNLVFILQLIALSAAAFALTQPIINIAYDSASANTVIVLDASASMGANNNARFSKAISIAEDSMKGDVSIILAEDYPVVLLEKGNAKQANDLLNIVKPKEVGSNIGDAMLLSKDLLDGKEGRVLVLSDFICTTGPDPNVVKKILEAGGAAVDLVNVGEKGSNVGIIDMIIDRYNTEVHVKNYNNEEKDVTVSVINGDNEIKKESLSIQPNSVNAFSFETPAGMTEVKINENDDLKADNTAFISAPEKTKIKVLMITSNVNEYLKKALESSKEVELTVANPPIVPQFTGFDIVILGDFDKSKLLTGTLEDLNSWISKGKSAIITARSDMNEID